MVPVQRERGRMRERKRERWRGRDAFFHKLINNMFIGKYSRKFPNFFQFRVHTRKFLFLFEFVSSRKYYNRK